jgi:hypothetical protein
LPAWYEDKKEKFKLPLIILLRKFKLARLAGSFFRHTEIRDTAGHNENPGFEKYAMAAQVLLEVPASLVPAVRGLVWCYRLST